MKRLLLAILLIVSFWTLGSLSTLADHEECALGDNPTRPGEPCETQVHYVHSNIADYPLTCADTVQIDYTREACGADQNPVARGVTFIDPTGTEFIDIEGLVNLARARLGGLGPDASIQQSASPDQLARVYPYNALADKPIFTASDTARESFRTFWRLHNLTNQLNAKATFFDRFQKQDPPIFNSRFPYVDPNAPPPQPEEGEEAPSTGPSGLPDGVGVNIGYQHFNDAFATAASGKPVTFLAPIDDPGAIAEFAAFYSGASRRIMRLTGLRQDTSDATLIAAAQAASAALSGSDVLVLGNELNDPREGYCPLTASLNACGQRYAAQFTVFRSAFSGPLLAAAPTNTSHTTRPATPFIQGAIAAYRDLSDIYAHNVYWTGNGTANDDVGRWSWEQSLFNAIASKEYVFTEYSLAPGPDEDLSAVLAFINAAPASGSPASITPLVRNVCPGVSGDWLIYDGTNLYNDNGNRIDPATCGAEASVIEYSDFSIQELISQLPPCLKHYPVCKRAEKVYNNLPSSLKAKYDAFQPFNFDNARGYLVTQYVDPENQNAKHSEVLKENLPYVLALKDVLNQKTSGVLNTLSPEWLNQDRLDNFFTADDYLPLQILESTDLNQLTPEHELYRDIAARVLELGQFKPSYVYTFNGQIVNIEKSPDQPDFGYQGLGCLSHDEGVTLPAPQTFPSALPDENYLNSTPAPPTSPQPYAGQYAIDQFDTSIQQVLRVPVRTIEQPESPDCPITQTVCDTNPITGAQFNCREVIVGYDTKFTTNVFTEDARHPVGGRLIDNIGRAIAVLNNPKMADFSYSISAPATPKSDASEPNFSLTYQLLPKFVTQVVELFKETPMLDKNAGQYSPKAASADDNTTTLEAYSDGTSTNQGHIARTGGQAEIDLCKFRNFWLRPAGLQVGQASDCEDLEKFMGATAATHTPASFASISGASCSLSQSGITSGLIYNTIVDAANWANVPVDVLLAVARKEGGCYDSPGDFRNRPFCFIDDNTVRQQGYLDYTPFDRNCSVRGPLSIGGSYTWPLWGNARIEATGDTTPTNDCNLKDSIYAAAKLLSNSLHTPVTVRDVSETQPANQWTQQDKYTALSRWAEGQNAQICGQGVSGGARFYCDFVDQIGQECGITTVLDRQQSIDPNLQ